MADSPKKNEEKMLQILNAWKTLAPDKKFGGMSLADFEAQVNKSLAPRTRLDQLEDEKKQQQALRESEDAETMRDLQFIVNGVLADPEFGDDSALYDAMGYIRRSNRQSGLTRRKKDAGKP